MKLSFSLSVEELAELFQWRGDSVGLDTLSKEDLDKIGQELADVTIYLIRLSDVSQIDLKAHTESLIQSGSADELASS